MIIVIHVYIKTLNEITRTSNKALINPEKIQKYL